MSMKTKSLFALSAVAMTVFAASAELVRWDFPRTGSCHEGMAFADGVTGVLVWGGDRTINLTVGRSDMWDHRGGYPWLPKQSYTNIADAIAKKDNQRLFSLFDKETPKGEPTNPYMLPLGRLVLTVKNESVRLVSGSLDPLTGLGELTFLDEKSAGGSPSELKVGIAMAKAQRTFAMKFPKELPYEVAVVPATDHDEFYRKDLQPLGFEKAVKRADGFDWRLPADEPVSLTFRRDGGELALATARGDKPAVPYDGFAAVEHASKNYWRTFWHEGCRVRLPDPVLQRVFEYGMYRFGAMTDPSGVPAGLQGPWLEDDKLVPWNGDYHFNINVQECYSPAYRGGHLRNLMPLFRMVLSWRGRLRENARQFVGIEDGYVLPHSVDDRGVCIGGFWTGTIDHGSTAWVGAMMMRYVRYSKDVAFLRQYAYDYMKGAMNVYRRMMVEDGDRLAIPMGPSPEWYGHDPQLGAGRNPSFQLAAAHRLARDLIEAAKLLGEEPDAMWLDVEKRLPLFSTAETECGTAFGIFEGTRLNETHRHHSHMAGLYPFDVIDFSEDPTRAVVWHTYKNWTHRGKGMWTGWCVPWASILWTHWGNPPTAVSLLHDWDTYFCNPGHGSHHNAVVSGFTEWDNGLWVMQMDGQCAAATAVMELLAHEVNGKTEFFRGCPDSWREVSFENLLLSDGRRVSGRRRFENGRFIQEIDFGNGVERTVR